MPTFYGKYRGVVTNNKDPDKLGRIRAKVPDVTGDSELGWAYPCAPFGGDKMGFFALPQVGTGVWMEFEQGDPDYPIWSGCWWSKLEQIPEALQSDAEKKVLIQTEHGQSLLFEETDSNKQITLQTTKKQKLLLEDAEGGGKITLQTSSGQKIILSDEAGGEITIQTANGQKVSLKETGQTITIQTASGQKITLEPATISLDNGTGATLEMSGPKIDMNHAALEVM